MLMPGPGGRYVLKERLAQGGMGEVFRAVAVGEHGFEKPVVVKRILPAHAGREDLADLFVAEAKLMTRLAHPNIVEVYDFGRGDHRDYYLVLELVDGVDLGRLLRAFVARGEPFPVPLALFVTAQVLRGLHHAHTRLEGEGVTIVHRDVSPGNVLLSTEGEVKVADFGIALMQRERDGSGAIAGKPGYMAPEQFEGRTVDARADVFSVGVVLHQLLAGSLQFQGENAEAQLVAARFGERTALPALRAEVGEGIEAIAATALQPLPGARFASARAMAQAIEGLREEGQRIASADDLAEEVRAARQRLPVEGRRVISLSSAAPEPGAEEAGAEEEAPRELTRTGAAGAAFTLRFPVRADATTRQQDGQQDEREPRRERDVTADRYAAPEPRTERIEPPGAAPQHEQPMPVSAQPEPVRDATAREEEAPAPAGAPGPRRSPAVRRLVAGVLVLAAAMGAVAVATRSGTEGEVRSAPTTAASTERPPATSSPSTSGAPPPVSVVQSAPAVGTTSPPPVRTPVPRAPSAPSPPSAAVNDDCTGKVHFSSDDSWDVAGGPARTQTPGIVVWRCGTYALQARYRPDPAQTRSVTITVRADRVAEVSLRLR